MKTVIIRDNQKGLLYKNGKLVRILGAGKYYEYGGRSIEVLRTDLPVAPTNRSLESVLALPEAKELITVIETADNELVLHYINGNCVGVTSEGEGGKIAYWNDAGTHTFRRISTEFHEMTEQFTQQELSIIPSKLYASYSVREYEKARLYVDSKLVRVLDAGTYRFWRGSSVIFAEKEDMRTMQIEISKQEILTADKVGLRINFVVSYRVTDAEKIVTVTQNAGASIYTAAQLVLREYVSGYKTDEILSDRERISGAVLELLRKRTEGCYVEIISAGIKDIILPGEISDIMNSVLAAEKRAQAKVIERREEVASTRSLLNTAKLMDENATLRKLKELEYIERICERVDSISVDGRRDLLSQLSSIITRE